MRLAISLGQWCCSGHAPYMALLCKLKAIPQVPHSPHARALFALSRALHANQTAGKLPWRWADCNNAIQYSHEDLLASVLPVYHELLQTGGCRRSSNGMAFTSSATAPEAGLLTFYGVIPFCRGLLIWSGTVVSR